MLFVCETSHTHENIVSTRFLWLWPNMLGLSHDEPSWPADWLGKLGGISSTLACFVAAVLPKHKTPKEPRCYTELLLKKTKIK